MDTPDWITVLGLFVAHPVMLIATFLIVCAVFYCAWWLRGHIDAGLIDELKSQIDGLKERLKEVRDQSNDINAQFSELKEQVESQENVINSSPLELTTAARVEELARSNTAIQNTITNLANATSQLGHTLTIMLVGK
jgi:uncharacterized phage infection (PIP) family protein YhgE